MRHLILLKAIEHLQAPQDDPSTHHPLLQELHSEFYSSGLRAREFLQEAMLQSVSLMTKDLLYVLNYALK